MEAWEIEAFLAIVRTGSLTQAAKLLHISQSAISYRLRKLEMNMNTKLVEREKGQRQIQLTPTGDEFAVIAERWTTLLRDVQVLQDRGPRMALTIGAVDSLNAFVLPSIYRRLSAHSSAISIRIRTHQTLELYELIDKREIDVAFVLQERYYRDIQVRRIYDEQLVLLTLPSSEYPDSIHPGDLDPANELYIRWGLEYQLWHDQWWDPLHPDRIHVDTAQLIAGLLHQDKQWAIVPISMARSLSGDGRFRYHHLQFPPPKRVCYRIQHRNPKSSTIQGLNVLEEIVANSPELI